MEIVVNIGVLITIVGFLLFLMRRIDNLRVEIKADMEKMETGIRADMKDMEGRITTEMNLKHGEVREDLRDVRVGLVQVREGQARLEGIVEGMGRAAEREPVVSGD